MRADELLRETYSKSSKFGGIKGCALLGWE